MKMLDSHFDSNVASTDMDATSFAKWRYPSNPFRNRAEGSSSAVTNVAKSSEINSFTIIFFKGCKKILHLRNKKVQEQLRAPNPNYDRNLAIAFCIQEWRILRFCMHKVIRNIG